MCKRIQTGFTLIQLLVVIAIIAILAALLLPTLARGKAEAQSTQCKSNLHQLGGSLRIYLNDDGGSYPYDYYEPANNAKGAFCWFDALLSNIPNGIWGSGVLSCPSYQWTVDPGGDGDGSTHSLGGAGGGPYCYNGDGSRWGMSGGLGGARYPDPLPSYPQTTPISENAIVAPAELYALGDAGVTTVAFSSQGTAPSVTELIGESDYGLFLGAFGIRPYPILKMQHSRWFNMLFADGHVASVKTNVLFSMSAVYLSKWNHDNSP